MYRLYHYYEQANGPFLNLSKLSMEDAALVSERIKAEGVAFAGRRSDDYLVIRRELENRAREAFILKGGRPGETYPHYMTLESCPWLKSWYKNPCVLSVDWDEIPSDSISFTYGDLFPTMRYEDDRGYRKQVYTKSEIIEVIERFGFPQSWNENGELGPERYIEAQVWDDKIIARFQEKARGPKEQGD